MVQYSDPGAAAFLNSFSREYLRAADIVRQYAVTSMDTLKLWPPKRYFFSPSRSSMIAYGVENRSAIALGDPVGLQWEFPYLVGEFLRFCEMQGWAIAFYRTRSDFLPIYYSEKFKKLKIGEDAIVELPRFSLKGRSKRDIRSKTRLFKAKGVSVVNHEPPLSSTVLMQLQKVSDEWLQIPGRRERSFGVGYFDIDYLGSTPVLTAVDSDGQVQAFINLRCSSDEMTGDLMRRRKDAPNGIMDYLFLNLLNHAASQGYSRVNLGLAPMSGFRVGECPSLEERFIHACVRKAGSFFSFSGLQHYKAKFATSWEPRFLVYQHTVQLPRIALALQRLA